MRLNVKEIDRWQTREEHSYIFSEYETQFSGGIHNIDIYRFIVIDMKLDRQGMEQCMYKYISSRL